MEDKDNNITNDNEKMSQPPELTEANQETIAETIDTAPIDKESANSEPSLSENVASDTTPEEASNDDNSTANIEIDATIESAKETSAQEEDIPTVAVLPKKEKHKKEKHRIVKSKKAPEYLPGMQKKLFVDVKDEDDLSFIDKVKSIFADKTSLYTIVIYVLIVINLLGITLFAQKGGLSMTQSFLYKLHFDSLTLETYTFLDLSVIASYIFAFIFGGLVTFAMIKLASLISKSLELLYSHKVTAIIMLLFLVVFTILMITARVSSGSFLSIQTCNWLTPLCTFAGGFCMYFISLRSVDLY